jgi:DNA-binding XRE family transcriptional regulator
MTPGHYKKLRLRLGMSQGQLAARMGVCRKTVNHRENGKPIPTEAKLAIVFLTMNPRERQ